MSQTNTHGHSTLFVSGESWIHTLHPFNKLAYVLLTGVIVYWSTTNWYVELASITLSVILLLLSGTFKQSWKLLWRILLPLSLFMLPIHGILFPGNKTILFSIHTFHIYREGLLFASNVLLQLSAIITASLLFVLSTPPADLMTAISRAGWPPSVAYLLGSPLILLPLMRRKIVTIQESQRARGLDAGGNFIQRFRALLPLISPLVLGSFVEIEQRAITLELRGFNSPGSTTCWRELSDSTLQRTARWLMLACATALFLYPFFQ